MQDIQSPSKQERGNEINTDKNHSPRKNTIHAIRKLQHKTFPPKGGKGIIWQGESEKNQVGKMAFELYFK